jgi:hypothetical protein
MAQARDYTLISLGLMSGSDTLRTALGGYYEIEDVVDAMDATWVPFAGAAGSGITTYTNNIPYLYGVASPSLGTTSSLDLMFSSIKAPYRFVGDKDHVSDDEQWRAKLIGGSYGTVSYGAFISNGTFSSTKFNFKLPYELREIKFLTETDYADYEAIEMTYDYNYYFPDYQNHVAGLDSELLIPSFYHLLSSYAGYGGDMSETMLNFINVEGTATTEEILFDPTITPYLPLYDLKEADAGPALTHYKNRVQNFRDYITDSVVANSLSASTIDAIEFTTKTLIFNSTSQNKLFSIGKTYSDVIPFTNKIQIPVDQEAESSFNDMIVESGFEDIFLNYINNIFVSELSPSDTDTYKNIATRITRDRITGAPRSSINTRNKSYKSYSLYNMLLDSVQNANFPNSSAFDLVGGQAATRQEIINAGGLSRYKHSLPSLEMLTEVKDYIETSGKCTFATYITDGQFQISEFMDLASETDYSEILAYRIEKYKGNLFTEGYSKKKVIQNFIFYNGENITDASEGSDLLFHDSQVKFGETYTYMVYAYALVYSANYKYSDLAITRQLSEPPEDGSGTSYCLQFYNPATGQTTDQLFDVGNEVDYYELENEFVTGNAEINSSIPYHADINISMEPSINIVQIPVITKVLTVQDHPSQPIDITPFQRMDNSQIIGFYAQVESAGPAIFPKPLTNADFDYKAAYMESNNLIEDEELTKTTISKPAAIEVYRRSVKPSSLSEFSGSLVATKPLSIAESDFKLSDCFYEEKILPNKKYYYLFRFLNENGNMGHQSPIIEAELIDDGGYKYAVFDSLTSEDLVVPTQTQPSTEFKKIIQLVPNIKQISMEVGDVDYGNTAAEEYDNLIIGTADDKIFDKKFKLRLTSKKTGEKIDLNITYKLKEG